MPTPNFPDSPTLNQEYIYIGTTWVWTGQYWRIKPTQGIAIYDEGTQITTTTSSLNFTGAGVTATATNNNVTVNISSTSTGDFGTGAITTTAQKNKIRFHWDTLAELQSEVSAVTYHGMIAHVHSEGRLYFAHAGAWIPVANQAEVSSGSSNPKITNIVVTDSAYVVVDDTAVDTAGGYIKITGTDFVTGCSVIVGSQPAASVTFISATEVRCQVSAQAAGTYIVYLVNPDGGVAIRVNGVTHSAIPGWQTSSALPDVYDNYTVSFQFTATDAVTYTVISGSLPTGLTLSSSGLLSGTIPTMTNDTTYTFTVRATDAQLQDSPRTFTVTVTVSDPYFKLTTLLLPGTSGNTIVQDSSVNNHAITVFGDSRASNFTPYGTGWAIKTDDRSYLTIPASSDFELINTDFTFEFWVNFISFNTMGYSGNNIAGTLLSVYYNGWALSFSGSGSTVTSITFQVSTSGSFTQNNFTVSLSFGVWYHVVLQRTGSSGSNLRLFINGIIQGSAQPAVTYSTAGGAFTLGSGSYTQNATYSGNAGYHISNVRLTKSSIYDITGFISPTTNLLPLAQTTLLICQSNRFINLGTNTGIITSGTFGSTYAQIIAFNPFGITNTGTSGSMYFDGTGDYLTIPTNAALAFGTENFTFECWVYRIGSGASQCIYLVNATAGFILYTVSNKVVVRSFGTADLITSTSNLQIAQWTHIAVSRSATTFSLWLNGSRADGGTAINSTNFAQGGVIIGTNEIYSLPFYGYVSNLRIIKGTAVYDPTQITIAVPTAPLTAITNTSLLTLQNKQPHNNHSFQDSSSHCHLITRAGNATQGTFSPFSQTGWSNYFNGSSFLLTGSGTPTNFNGVNWTIEFWFYKTVLSGGKDSIFQSTTGTNNWIPYLGLQVRNDLTIGVNFNAVEYISAETYSLNIWNHVAVVRNNGFIKVYLNGNVTSINVNTDIINSNLVFWIGKTDNSPGGGSYLAYYNGYLSNLRIIKNQALYTGNFTPATSALTANTVGATGAGAAASITGTVSLLTCQSNRFVDNSTNNFAFTVSGTPSVQAFSPFAPTATYSPAVHGGSAYFDGTGDSLQIPNNTFNVSSSDITIELWAYFLSLSGEREILEFGTGGTGDLQLLTLNNNFQFGGSGQAKNNFAAVTNQWYHLAAVKIGNTYYLYVNGIRNTAQSSGSASASTVINIGSRNNSSNYLSGYISNFRISNFARYTTSTIAVPTSPVSADANTVVLLNFTNAAITDATANNVLETVGDARISTAQSKWAGGSMSFDGSGDYLSAPTSTLFGFGTGDFTIEFWVYFNSTTNQTIMGFLTNSNSIHPYLYINSTIRYFTGGIDRIISSSAPSTGTWHHLAITRQSGSTKMFLNGTQTGSTYSDSNDYGQSAPLGVGTFWNNGVLAAANTFNGYISDLRITKRVARYTANFTPPSGSFRLK